MLYKLYISKGELNLEILKSIGFLIVLNIVIYLRYLLAFIAIIFFIRGLYLKINNRSSEKAFNTSNNFFIGTMLAILLPSFLAIIIFYFSSL